jgi:hypothetical protein
MIFDQKFVSTSLMLLMSRFHGCLRFAKLCFLVTMAIIGVVNLGVAVYLLNWFLFCLLAISTALVVVIYFLARLLYRVLFCSSSKKLNKVLESLNDVENFSEDSLLLILDLNAQDLAHLNKVNLFPSSTLLKRLNDFKVLLQREIGVSRKILTETAERMLKDTFYTDDDNNDGPNVSDKEWYQYLETKLHYEEMLLQRVQKKQKEVIRLCKFNNLNKELEILFSQDSKQVDTCSICLSEYEHHQKVITLNCNHLFHQNCLEDWMIEKPNCPLCKTEV